MISHTYMKKISKCTYLHQLNNLGIFKVYPDTKYDITNDLTRHVNIQVYKGRIVALFCYNMLIIELCNSINYYIIT